MAMILDIADALVSALNDEEFSMALTAERGYVPSFDLPDTTTGRILVVPKGLTIERLTRASFEQDYRIDVGIQQKLEDLDTATIDPFMALVEEVADFCNGLHMGTTPEAVCIAVANEPIFGPEQMREMRMFVSLLTLTFRACR